MPDLLDRFIYRAVAGTRFSWYLGQKLLAERLVKPTPTPPELKARLPPGKALMADLRAVLARDLAHIEAGDYAPPADLADNPVAALRRAGAFFRDLGRVDARRHAERHQEIAEAPPEGRFPRYYLQNFHYQTDGWLSRRSAEIYDHQVEVLFMGGADAMRRQALLPIAEALAPIGQRRARLIDIGCGTGRFLREVKNNWPRLAVTALDLSPFYLDEARAALAGWSGTRFVAAPAEDVPEPDAAYDIATAIFLFHELPPKARRDVAAEFARLVRPGGVCVLIDSLQTGDRPDYDGLLDLFPVKFHEPYYASYLGEDLAALFGAAGFEAIGTRHAFLSKTVTFRRMPERR
jgi:ubiquinone/menaquinone biosynthesis C-methylase UbiE